MNMPTKMKLLGLALAAGAALGAIAAFAVPVLARPHAPAYAESTRTTPQSAFLRQAATTKSDLLMELSADSGARKGYAKVFHVAPWAVVTFLRQHAALSTMQRAGKFTVWRVTAEGTIYPTVQSVDRGVPVFVLKSIPSGLPQYISTLGDPMKPFATAVTTLIIRTSPVTRVAKVSPSQETIVPTQAQETIVPVASAVYPAPAAPAARATTKSGGTP